MAFRPTAMRLSLNQCHTHYTVYSGRARPVSHTPANFSSHTCQIFISFHGRVHNGVLRRLRHQLINKEERRQLTCMRIIAIRRRKACGYEPTDRQRPPQDQHKTMQPRPARTQRPNPTPPPRERERGSPARTKRTGGKHAVPRLPSTIIIRKGLS